jgi:hypothetical protein
MERALESFSVEAEFLLPFDQAGLLARLRGEGKIRRETFEEGGIRVRLDLPRSLAWSLRDYAAAGMRRGRPGREGEES